MKILSKNRAFRLNIKSAECLFLRNKSGKPTSKPLAVYKTA